MRLVALAGKGLTNRMTRVASRIRNKNGSSCTGRPHYRHLMAKPPRLEPLDQTIECNSGGAYLPLVVRQALRLVIGNRIVILAHVSEHAQQSFALHRAAFTKAA